MDILRLKVFIEAFPTVKADDLENNSRGNFSAVFQQRTKFQVLNVHFAIFSQRVFFWLQIFLEQKNGLIQRTRYVFKYLFKMQFFV